MKDNWRYKLVPDFVLDKHLAYNPEDEMIAAIDGDVEDEPEYEWNYHDIIENHLESREARIVDMHLSDGLSFSEIGNDYGVSKQRAHYIYKRACKKIRRAIDG
tara:strand:+ start:403 stop:711 length:309 start_codon:yes stop_codon:yes gene_type:complete